MKTSIEIVQKGTETPPTFWRLPARRGGENCLGPAPGFHAFALCRVGIGGVRTIYRSLCHRETMLKLGHGARVGRPPVDMRCKACDVEEQMLHMSWTPLPATEAAPRRKSKGGV